MRKAIIIALVALPLSFLAGCGGGGVSGPPAPVVTVALSPPTASIFVGQTTKFAVTVTGSNNTAVTWSVNNVAGGNATVGSIEVSGLYTAPAIPPIPNVVTVKAVSAADSSRSATGSVTIINPPPTLVSISPAAVDASSPDTTVTLTGANFAPQSQAQLSGTALATTFVSATELTTVIPAAGLTNAGSYPVRVVTPGPGGGASTAADLLVLVVVGVTPSAQNLTVSQSQQFVATVTGSANQGVAWSVNGIAGGDSTVGTIDASGFYVAPAVPPSPNTVTVTATSAADTSRSTSVPVFVVNPTPTIQSISPLGINMGSADTTLTVAGMGFAQQSVVQLGATPLATSFGNSTQLTAVIPSAQLAATGNFPVTVVTPSPGGGTSATETLTVNQAPAITSASDATFTVGYAESFTLTATGFPTPTLSESGAPPTGVMFNTTTGALSGTPGAGTGGTYPITFTASNGVGTNATQNFTLMVHEAPAVTSANNMAFTVGAAGSFTATATGFPTPTLSQSGALPGGVNFNASSGSLSGTPDAGTGGTYPITITAENGVGMNATQNFALTVHEAPAVSSGTSTTFAVGAAGSFTVTATGFPVPTLSLSGALPTGVMFNTSTGVLSGTPGAGTGGTYPITITASNGIGTNATQNFTLTVNQASAITSANNTTFTVGTLGSFTVAATGFPTPTLSESGELPTGVTFNTSTGALSGTPGAGTGGTYPITVTASNGVGTNATQNFTLTVNQAPAITSANSTTFTVGTAGSFTVTATGFPTPTLSETGTLPSGVTFTSATGVLGGTPGPNGGGIHNITFTASNGVGPNATQNFTLTVNNPAPTITSLSPPTVNAGGPAASITVNGTGFDQQSMVNVDGAPVTTTFSGSSVQLGAVVPSAKLTTSGTLQITVVTPSPGGGTSNSVALTVVTTVTVSPSARTLSVNRTRQFTATVAGITDQSVTWFVDDIPGGSPIVGTIDAAGIYITPGTVPSPETVTVKAVSVADPTKSGIATVTIIIPPSDNYPRPGATTVVRPNLTPLIQIPSVGARVAVLDWTAKNPDDTEEDVVAICHALSTFGIPHTHTTDLSVADNSPVIAVAGVLEGSVSGGEEQALINYVKGGGTLLLWRPNDSGLLAELGISSLYSENNVVRRPMTFDLTTNDPALRYVDHEVEVNWQLAYPTWGNTRAYDAGSASELATWSRGGAAVLRVNQGTGRAYVFGWRLSSILVLAELGIAPGGAPDWTNILDLDADICRLLVRAIYEGWAGAGAPLRTFAPEGKPAALIITHDVDARVSYENIPAFAQFDVDHGLRTSYFFTTMPYSSSWAGVMYTLEGIENIRYAQALGHDIGSHSFGHFPDFNDAPLGTGQETAENYMPDYSYDLTRTFGFSALGELGVSRWLLENDLGITIDIYRSGELLTPPDFLEALEQTGYRRDTTYAVGTTRGSFPFVPIEVSSGMVTTFRVLEFPVALSEEGLTPETLQALADDWMRVIRANHDNNAPTVLLIHPTNSVRLDLLTEVFARISNDPNLNLWLGDLKTFADFWEAQGVTCDRWP